MRKVSVFAVIAPLLTVVACVGLQKSENPLSPTVAGPIPGVALSAPEPMQPGQGVGISTEAQPVTLTFKNASTNGVRPFSYTLDIAADANFTNLVFTRTGITPSDGATTSFRLPSTLGSDRTYYWRVRADDGANKSDYSYASRFVIFTPIVIGKPVAVAPAGGITTDDTRPRFVIANAPRSGPVGPMGYVIEVSTSQAFGSAAAVWVISETPGQSQLTAPGNLPASATLFWRTRAFDPTTTGPYSDIQTFKTPAPVVAPTPGSGGGVGTSGHLGSGPATVDRARETVLGTGQEFPSLVAANTEAAGEQLMLRMIWHLQLNGFQAARQQNPSGTISGDKLAVFAGGAWRAYDVVSTSSSGRLDVHFNEVVDISCCAGDVRPVTSSGIPD